jgi:hypothetical protein
MLLLLGARISDSPGLRGSSQPEHSLWASIIRRCAERHFASDRRDVPSLFVIVMLRPGWISASQAVDIREVSLSEYGTQYRPRSAQLITKFIVSSPGHSICPDAN